jgi:uncharacterized protein (DUF1800 family)
MTHDARRAAALALHRFGLGPHSGLIAAIASDPCGALLAELERPSTGRQAQRIIAHAYDADRPLSPF